MSFSGPKKTTNAENMIQSRENDEKTGKNNREKQIDKKWKKSRNFLAKKKVIKR